jgi:hypothetical protein
MRITFLLLAIASFVFGNLSPQKITYDGDYRLLAIEYADGTTTTKPYRRGYIEQSELWL